MPKFRKKPVEIEAVQFTGDNWAEMHEFTGHVKSQDGSNTPFDAFDQHSSQAWAELKSAVLWNELSGDWESVHPRMWVVKNEKDGGFYSCSEYLFNSLYEPAE